MPEYNIALTHVFTVKWDMIVNASSESEARKEGELQYGHVRQAMADATASLPSDCVSVDDVLECEIDE